MSSMDAGIPSAPSKPYTQSRTGGDATARADLSILIINWKSVDYLKPCLASIFREVQGIEFEVIVVDNASYDGSAELIRCEFPQVTFIQSSENLGFIRGNNLAYRYATGRNLLLLNPDTEIIGGAITIMHSYLDSLPQAGIIGCRQVNADRSIQMNCIQPFPTILNQFFDSDYLRRKFPKSHLWGMAPLFEKQPTFTEVDMVCGACLMVKRQIFEEVGLLSLDYVMYSDDLDLCYKVKKAGYKVYFTNQAEVIHHGGKSSASLKQAVSDVWIRDSMHKFLLKSRGKPYASVYKVAMASGALTRLALLAFAKLIFGRGAHSQRLAVAFTKWKRILQWAFGVTYWVKNADKAVALPE